MFGTGVGFWEMIVIGVIVLLLFGPDKIPEIARGLGQGVRMMRNATDDIKREIMKEVDEVNPVSDLKKEIDEAKETIDDLTNSIKR